MSTFNSTSPHIEGVGARKTLEALKVRFPALDRLRRREPARVPVVLQLTGSDCGPACLAMVLAYYGRPTGMEELRNAVGPGRDGANIQRLLVIARRFGLRGRLVKLDVDKLRFLKKGAVLHWDFNHFVVLESFGPDGAWIVDPAVGRRHASPREVGGSFTGVALELTPSDTFTRGGHPPHRLGRYWAWLRGERGYWSRVVATSLALQVLALAIPGVTGALVDRVIPREDRPLLTLMVVGLVTLAGCNFLISFVKAHLLLYLRTTIDVRMTFGFLEHLLSLPYSFFQRRSAGDLLMRLNSNATIRELLTSTALSAPVDGVLAFAYLLLVFIGSPSMGALVVGIALVQVALYVVSSRSQHELTSAELSAQAKLSGYQSEMLAGIQTLKAMGQEARAAERWTDLCVDVMNASIRRGRLSALFESTLGTIRLVAPLAILLFGAKTVLEGTVSLGTMLSQCALAGGFLAPIGTLVLTAMQVQTLRGYMERIEDVMDARPERDPSVPGAEVVLRGGVSLDRVSFRYGPEDPLVLDDVSVDVAPGQFVALVGASGAGKSTLASLLAGLYAPTGGSVSFDGIDVARLEIGALRRALGVVPQDPYLFGTTIRQNIALACPDAPLEAIIAAAKLAHIHDDIEAMPMGYDTLLVDAGASLSGGQRQRITLSRALLTAPAILLLDESTSALDAITEAKIQRSIASLQCTRIVVAHRLSTIVDADVILVLDEGKLAERGTHAELLALGGVYARLVAAQLGEHRSAV